MKFATKKQGMYHTFSCYFNIIQKLPNKNAKKHNDQLKTLLQEKILINFVNYYYVTFKGTLKKDRKVLAK